MTNSNFIPIKCQLWKNSILGHLYQLTANYQKIQFKANYEKCQFYANYTTWMLIMKNANLRPIIPIKRQVSQMPILCQLKVFKNAN